MLLNYLLSSSLTNKTTVNFTVLEIPSDLDLTEAAFHFDTNPKGPKSEELIMLLHTSVY